MNEYEVKIAGLRAQIEGMAGTIEMQAEEITNLRKQLVRMCELQEDAARDMGDLLQEMQKWMDTMKADQNVRKYIAKKVDTVQGGQ